MAKKGGTKRKIPMEKIRKKNSLAVCFSKRRYGLLSKVSQLCLLSGAQIAVLATPPSSESNVSFYSFGDPSIVTAFLTGQRPVPEDNKEMREDVGICMARKELGLEYWWEDERLDRSENLEELKDTLESMSNLLKNANELFGVKNNQRDHHQHQEEVLKKSHSHLALDQEHVQTLSLESTICCIPDDLHKTNNEIVVFGDDLHKTDNEIVVFCDDLSANQKDDDQAFVSEEELKKNDVFLYQGAQDPDQTLNLDPNSTMCWIPDDNFVFWNDGLPQNLNRFVENIEEQDQILTICENSCVTNYNNNSLDAGSLDAGNLDAGNLDGCSNKEIELDQFIDRVVLGEEELQFSDFLNDF